MCPVGQTFCSIVYTLYLVQYSLQFYESGTLLRSDCYTFLVTGCSHHSIPLPHVVHSISKSSHLPELCQLAEPALTELAFSPDQTFPRIHSFFPLRPLVLALSTHFHPTDGSHAGTVLGCKGSVPRERF